MIRRQWLRRKWLRCVDKGNLGRTLVFGVMWQCKLILSYQKCVSSFFLAQAIRDASALYRRYADDGKHASPSSPSPLSPNSTSSSSSHHFNLGGLSDSPRRSELQIALLVLLARAYSLVAFTAAAAVSAASAAAAETASGDANSAKHRNRLVASSGSAALHAMECECAVLLDAALRQSHARWGAQSPQHVEVRGIFQSCMLYMNRVFGFLKKVLW
jgi:hypothetical protein